MQVMPEQQPLQFAATQGAAPPSPTSSMLGRQNGTQLVPSQQPEQSLELQLPGPPSGLGVTGGLHATLRRTTANETQPSRVVRRISFPCRMKEGAVYNDRGVACRIKKSATRGKICSGAPTPT